MRAALSVHLLVLFAATAFGQNGKLFRSKKLNPFGLLPNTNAGIQSILNSFSLRTNTIIRTNDSLQSGARYLNERQLRSSAECSLYCWEMLSCNVAVFEEKSNGACYLFDCGTPDNFACQFTPHDAYTVALLTTRSQHENELVSLKHTGHGHGPDSQDQRFRPEELPPGARASSGAPVSSSSSSSTSTSSSSTTSTTSTTTSTTTTTTTTTTKKPESRCAEHQFRCVNSSECIAIYDVCNGIPQCADGSDEAETLDCHAPNRQTPKQVELSDSQLYDIVRPLQEKLQETQDGVYRHQGVYEETRQRGEYAPYRSDLYRGGQANDYGDVYPGRRYPGLYSQQQDFQGSSRFEDSQIGGAQGYAGETGGLYQSASTMQRGYDNAPDFPSNYYPYGRDRGYAPNGLNGGVQADQMGGRAVGNLDAKASFFGSPRFAPNGPGLPQQESEKQLQMAKSATSNIVRDPLVSLETPKANQRVDAGAVLLPSNGMPRSEAKPRRRPGKLMDEAPPPPEGAQPNAQSVANVAPNARPTTRPEPAAPAKQIANMHISVTQVETKTSSTTSGAMVGLALGLCMSTLFLVVVGCRLNMRRRLSRWRRGGSKKGLSLLAPEDDEDYLVNGMYL